MKLYRIHGVASCLILIVNFSHQLLNWMNRYFIQRAKFGVVGFMDDIFTPRFHIESVIME